MPALQITRKKSRRKRSVWGNPLFWILLILLIGGIVALIIWATSKKSGSTPAPTPAPTPASTPASTPAPTPASTPSPPGPAPAPTPTTGPTPGPTPGPTKLSFYVEDCQQSGKLTYNYDKLAKEFDFIGFDFSPNCYNSINKTIVGLNNSGYSGQLGIHFDQTTGDSCNTSAPLDSHQRACGATGKNPNCQTISDSCINNLHKVIGDAAFSKIDAIIWEKEGNRLMDNCDVISCKKFFTNSFKKYPTSKFSEFAGWTTKFDFTVPLPHLASWDYIFYEYYNIFEGACKSINNGGTKEYNKNCFVDYNPLGGKCFEGATTDLNGKQAGCGAGKDTVYCSNTTPAQKGQYMASVLVKKYKGKVPKIPDNQVDRTVIFFTFTNASIPTWLDTLTTPTEFNEFLRGFTSTLKAAGCDNIDQCKFGAWGCPRWIADSSSNFCSS